MTSIQPTAAQAEAYDLYEPSQLQSMTPHQLRDALENAVMQTFDCADPHDEQLTDEVLDIVIAEIVRRGGFV